MIWDNSPAHRCDAIRAYLATPGLNLRLVNPVSSTGQALPSYSPDFNADEAIWGWAREEARQPVPGDPCRGAGEGGRLFTDLDHRREEVKRRCRTILQARAAELTRTAQAHLSDPANVDFTLASV